jgi:hypothetical protein
MMDHPGLARFIAQASIGYIVSNFALIIARIFLVPGQGNDWFVFWLAVVFVVGLGVGTAAGLIIWLCAVMLRHSPNAIYRSVIGMVVVAALWFFLALSLDWEPRTPIEQLWVLAVIIVPGIGIGAVTDSKFRLWHELVRQGEAVRRLPRILAGFTGLVLRPVVVFSFMSCLIVLIARLQEAYYWGGQGWVWPALLCGHFAAGMAVLFARLKTSLLFPLALIANAPIVAALVQFHVSRPDVPFVAIPYLSVWAVFLLTRWRQTDLALGVLNEEIHYYLID